MGGRRGFAVVRSGGRKEPSLEGRREGVEAPPRSELIVKEFMAQLVDFIIEEPKYWKRRGDLLKIVFRNSSEARLVPITHLGQPYRRFQGNSNGRLDGRSKQAKCR